MLPFLAARGRQISFLDETLHRRALTPGRDEMLEDSFQCHVLAKRALRKRRALLLSNSANEALESRGVKDVQTVFL